MNIKTNRRRAGAAVWMALAVAISGCGGSPGSSHVEHSVSGTVTGLMAGNAIVLSNGGESVSVTANGRFAFAQGVAEQSAYRVQLGATTPIAQPCTSTYGVGTMGQRQVDNVTVICGLPGGTGTFTATPLMDHARYDHRAVLLANGKVLLSHGQTNARDASAELYDPASGTFEATGAPTARRVAHTATRLRDGRVLVVGGADWGNGLLFAEYSAELYDPAKGTWTRTGDMDTARKYHTATLLSDGKVLVVGGSDKLGRSLAGAEIYDPATGKWRGLRTMHDGRWGHAAVLLPTGKVLISGGVLDGTPANPYAAGSELFDPLTENWSSAGRMVVPRSSHSATLLPSGKVLAAGGAGAGNATELFDPATGTWTAAAPMISGRFEHTATLLPTGQVLAAGGRDEDGLLGSAELYDAASGQWTAGTSLLKPRRGHAATLLTDGRLLVSAGGDDDALMPSAELYH